MSVTVDAETVIKGLWRAPSAEPAVLSNGRFLQMHFDSRGALNASKALFGVSALAFHPVDETQAVVGTTAGVLYGVSFRENKVFLLAHLGEPTSVRAVAFCGSSAANAGWGGFPDVVAVSEANLVSFVDWHTGTILQQSRCGAHARAITAVSTSPHSATASNAMRSQLVALVSADAVSCWIPQRSIAQGDPRERRRYICVGTAAPAQSALPSGEREMNSPARLGAGESSPEPATTGRELHRLLSVHVLKGRVYTIETNGVLARWSVPTESLAYPNAPRALTLESCVHTLPFRASCSGCCSVFLALGCRDMAAVALVDGETMQGLGVFHITQGSGQTPQATWAGRKSLPSHVQQLSIIGSEVVCCLLSDGRVVAVAASTHQCVFVMQPPQAGVENRFGVPRNWQFAASGPTYGAFTCASDCVFLHLPTARAYYERCVKLYAEATEGGDDDGLHFNPPLIRSGETGKGGGDSEAHGAGDVMTFTVKVLPFLSQRRERGERGERPRVQRTTTATEEVSGHSSRRVSASSRQRFPRKPLVFEVPASSPDAASPRASWIDVNTAETAKSGASDAGVAREDSRSLSVLARALYSDTLSDAACAYNMEKLRQYLNRYGVFPKTFRPAIWRFVLGLPDRKRTAPQFASLARRRMHGCVATHMEPFPLPPSAARSTIEQCVSVLAHHDPAFAVADFLPAFVFPFLHVFSDDDNGQSVVEVLLTFFCNWGYDFFQCYPQPPSNLMHFMQRRLAAHDVALSDHFSQMGCGPEVWCWRPALSAFTDTLTAAEWLQVMDHAFMMEPMWLYMFHLAMLLSHRTALLREGAGVQDVVSILSSPLSLQQQQLEQREKANTSGFGKAREAGRRASTLMSNAIELAYQLHSKCPRDSPFMEHYFDFQTLEPPLYEYPTAFPVDEEVLRTRMAELYNLETKREEEKLAADRLRALTKEAADAAVREEVLLQQQRSRIAAKYDASSETWRARVALEKARQVREAKERETRMEALRSRVASAEELERIRQEMELLKAQNRHDIVDRLLEQHKWVLASDITAAELEQLERDAQIRVAEGLRKLVQRNDSDGAERLSAADKERSASAMSGAGEQSSLSDTNQRQGAPLSNATADRRTGGEASDGGSGPAGGSAAANGYDRANLDAENRNAIQQGSAGGGDDDDGERRDSDYDEAELCAAAEPPVPFCEHGNQQGEGSYDGGEGGPIYVDDGAEPAFANEADIAVADTINDEEGDNEDEVYVDKYHNHDEYPPQGPEDVGDSYDSQPLVGGPEVRPANASESHERNVRRPPDADVTFDDARLARPAPLPRHLAPFVPSSELLNALQSYRRSPAADGVRGSRPLASQPAADAASYVDERQSFEPCSRSVLPPYQQQLQALQAEVQRLQTQLLDATPSGATVRPDLIDSSARWQPSSVKERVAHVQNRRPLFDNLSDVPTPTTTTTTTTTITSNTVTTGTTTETASSPTTGSTRPRSPPRTTTTTATTTNSYDDSHSYSGNDEATRHMPTRGSRYHRGQLPNTAQVAAATMPSSSRPLHGHSSESPSSSAASALQRPWRDEYYWRSPAAE